MSNKMLKSHIVVRRPNGFTLDIELDIEPGTTVALLGPNGAGKSTTVDALGGIEPLHEGRIELAGAALDDPGADVFVPPQDRGIGIVFQDYLLFDHMSVRDNISVSYTHLTLPTIYSV